MQMTKNQGWLIVALLAANIATTLVVGGGGPSEVYVTNLPNGSGLTGTVSVSVANWPTGSQLGGTGAIPVTIESPTWVHVCSEESGPYYKPGPCN